MRIKVWPMVVAVVVLAAGIGTFAMLHANRQSEAGPHLILQQDGNTMDAVTKEEIGKEDIPIQQRGKTERAPYQGCTLSKLYQEQGVHTGDYQTIEVVSRDNRVSLFPTGAIASGAEAYLSYDQGQEGEGFCFFWATQGGQLQEIELVERINLIAE